MCVWRGMGDRRGWDYFHMKISAKYSIQVKVFLTIQIEYIKTSKFFKYSKQITLHAKCYRYPAVKRNLFRMFEKLFLFWYFHFTIINTLAWIEYSALIFTRICFWLKNIFENKTTTTTKKKNISLKDRSFKCIRVRLLRDRYEGPSATPPFLYKK